MLSSKNKARFLSVFIVLAMLFSFANVSPAHAAVGIVVNSSADTVADDGSKEQYLFVAEALVSHWILST